MNLEKTIKSTLDTLKNEDNPSEAFGKLIQEGKKELDSDIWDALPKVDIDKDISEAKNWLLSELSNYPGTKGLYFGLDTLNMDEGRGHNVEIGFSKSCNPAVLNDEWTYECDKYGESHLIKGLFDMWKVFYNKEKWSAKEVNFVEYVVFLGYSGIVLKQALTQIDSLGDYLSMWGFHDGDMGYLIQSVGGNKKVLAEMI